ncbi:hypothetical protein BCR34DRAFT_163568 [Clohesyomyces aquaticus]|uniref:Uncharacterized protein n=1 Tax=Clohesyomyces aquaticus TaxID=1231657 RepID=A0A1Y1ZZZ0_9PLEO|nr:hypothetical protein BCR34DRAFT_163568 [Clohesyomyces aquaticus]
MAAHHQRGPSPQQQTAHHAYAYQPVTPIHSPHHSLNSSTSSRTPHTLTLHEYRKQQHTPTSQSATPPPGKTLRRKAAAAALNEIERVPSVTRTPVGGSHPFRPLHLSQSAHQLATHNPLPPSPPHFFQLPAQHDRSFCSQSAEPRDPGGTPSGYPTSSGSKIHYPSLGLYQTTKVSNWKTTKRLPKPPAAASPIISPVEPSSPFSLAPLVSSPALLSSGGRFPGVGGFSGRSSGVGGLSPVSSGENLGSSGGQTTSSTFSLSRFPQPPHLVDPSLPPPNEDNVPSRLNIGFTATAPETPPATPAVLHYRGTSFDLVNPHESLLLHDIETPTRDTDSPEYFLLGSSEDALIDPENMPPRRALYGDLSSAYNNIKKRDNESPSMEVPGSAEGSLAMDSRFSLKQLTRNLTRNLAKTPEPQEQELQELPPTQVELADHNWEGPFPRPLTDTYRHKTADSSHNEQPGGPDYNTPLASMVPDEPSTQLGRGDTRISYSGADIASTAYYEDMSSIYNYRTSSVYTHENGDNSGYPPSLSSKRRSTNPFRPLSYQTGEFPTSPYGYSNVIRASKDQGDTISKFIDQYGQGAENPLPRDERRITSGLSQFDFDINRGPGSTAGSPPVSPQSMGSPFEYDEHPTLFRRPNPSNIFSGISSYGDTRQLLELSQPGTGEGTNLQLIPEEYPAIHGATIEPSSSYSQAQELEPSYSYSQPENEFGPSSSYSQAEAVTSPRTPMEALDHAEHIFGGMSNDQDADEDGIPAMWARRSSGNFVNRNRDGPIEGSLGRDVFADPTESLEGDRGDWETINENNSRAGRQFVDDGSSVADYSDTEDGQDGLSVIVDDEDIFLGQDMPLYGGPGSLPGNGVPFASSPLPLFSPTAANTTQSDSNATSSTMPLFSNRQGSTGQPHSSTPYRNPYELSDKETQELLNSGPNDEIIYNERAYELRQLSRRRSNQAELPALPTNPIEAGMERENTFEKMTFLGPKGNLTGTPQGTGMREVGSSVADSSSPGAALISSPENPMNSPRGVFGRSSSNTRVHGSYSGKPGPSTQAMMRNDSSPRFYSTPGRTTSNTKIRASFLRPNPEHERRPSEITIFPSHFRMGNESSQVDNAKEKKRVVGEIAAHRYSINIPPLTPVRTHNRHRPAVHGQTKLREMVLASHIETIDPEINESHYVSRLMRAESADRASSTNTRTPLRAYASQTTIRTVVADKNSPHLLCPERAFDQERERERQKKSWFLFALFCILPPMLLLYRFFADWCMAIMTNGDFGHCTPRTKQIATYAGVAINIALCAIILIPILIAHAAGTL